MKRRKNRRGTGGLRPSPAFIAKGIGNKISRGPNRKTPKNSKKDRKIALLSSAGEREVGERKKDRKYENSGPPFRRPCS